MRVAAVAEARISADPGPGLGHVGMGAQVDVLMRDGPPQALGKDVVSASALAIHGIHGMHR